MASLRNIMNVDDDLVDSFSLKKPKESVPRFASHPESSTSAPSYPHQDDYSIASSSSPSSSAKPHRHSTTSSRPLHPVASQGQSSTSGPSHAADSSVPDARQSASSSSTMDIPYAQGFVQSHGHAGVPYPGAPPRPYDPSGEAPVKLTPITGRVSRAKKGLAVHTCELCRPPKTFTRAEHLRRHQKSHQPPDLACQVPGCEKVFHRKDLLDRHQQRHDQDERMTSRVRRRSSSRSIGPVSPHQGSYGGPSSGSPLHMAPSFNSPPPGTSPTVGVSARGMSIGSAPWPSPSTSTPRLRDTQDYAMSGVKTEYSMDSLSSLEAVPVTMSPGFSESHPGAGLGLMDVPELCISVGSDSLSVSWQEGPGMVSSTSGSAYSTPPPTDLPVSRGSSGDWTGSFAPSAIPRSMPSPIVGAGGYPSPFAYGSSPPQVYPSIYGEAAGVTFPGYEEGFYNSPAPSNTARSLSPQMGVGPCSETLVGVASALRGDRTLFPGACSLQPETAFGLLTAQDFMPVTLSHEAINAMPTYLDVYWDKVHPAYPIIHKATFESPMDIDTEHVDILRCAMAAVATQFLGHRDNRVNGSQLHAYAWQMTRNFTQSSTWPLPIMQAVLLCEYYSRFRGRSKEAYRPSPRFHTLCQVVTAGQHQWAAATARSSQQERWRGWVCMESRRRLLAACFLLSVHGNWYYEQPFAADFGLDICSPMMLSIPLSANSTQAWEAESVEDWVSHDAASIRVQTVGDMLQQVVAPASIEGMPSFDASLLLAAQALQLPRRSGYTEVEVIDDASSVKLERLPIVKLFPRSPVACVYLALHYTPLHWLLSVSGDSWVFNKKVAQITCFIEHQRKLERWRKSGSAAVATLFAAKALKSFLGLNLSAGAEGEGGAASQLKPLPWRDISDFWGVYVCTLICWAFGHVGKPGTRKSSRAAAAAWILKVSELEPGSVQGLVGDEDSQRVVGLVRDVLERDCLGGRSILYADAVGVLRKLEEGDNWKRF